MKATCPKCKSDNALIETTAEVKIGDTNSRGKYTALPAETVIRCYNLKCGEITPFSNET